MSYGVVFEPVQDPGFPAGYYYAHIPSLGLTTQGLEVEGARAAALDLVQLWLAERQASGETWRKPAEPIFSTIEIPDDALQSA